MPPAAPRSRPAAWRDQGASGNRARPTQHFMYNVEPVATRRRCARGSPPRKRPMNYLRTAILLAGLTALFMGVGYLIGGASGAVIALLVAAGMNLASYWNADKLGLAMHDAPEGDETTAPELGHLVQDLARRAGLPLPHVYLMDNPQPNAFATGRNPEHAAVAATTGLLQMRSRDNNSGLGVTGTLAMVILAPVAAMIVQMAISRTREYSADELGARTTGRPDALASALAKISAAAQTIENPSAERTPATAHLFIVNPLTGQRMDNLFSTHPSTENRIAALERLAGEIGSGGYGPRPRAPPHPPRPPGPLGSPRARGENPGPREQNYLLSLRPNLP